MKEIGPGHPLRHLFLEAVHEEVLRHVSSQGYDLAEAYLCELLLDFLRTDRLYAIKDSDGKPVTSVIEMAAEGDIRLNATSFDREREVHKHIGDFILFWAGVYPDFLTRLKCLSLADIACDYKAQGRNSYRLVSTFRHPPFDGEAPVFELLSEGFDDFAFVLRQVASKTRLYAA